MGNTSDFKNGLIIEHKNGLYKVIEFLHVKPGKGGAFVRTKLKNIKTGQVIDETFRSGASIKTVRVEAREYNFLYNDTDSYIFMDNETYEQLNVDIETLGETANYVVEGSSAVLLMYGDEIVSTELTASVELVITETEPGMQGDRVSGATKPATLETGLTIQVPLFLEIGEAVKVDTRTGSYISRA